MAVRARTAQLLCVYASRPNIAGPVNALEDDRRAEVGYFYKNGWIAEIIATVP